MSGRCRLCAKSPAFRVRPSPASCPLSGDFEGNSLQFESYPSEKAIGAYRYEVTPQYFATMRIPLLRGRLLTENDKAGAPGAVLISDSLARRLFPNRDPVGERVRMGPDFGRADRPWHIVVGVVGNVKQASLALDDPDAFYTTPTQWAWVDGVQSLVVRTNGDPTLLIPAVRSAIWSVDKDQPIVRVATMESWQPNRRRSGTSRWCSSRHSRWSVYCWRQ